MTTTILFSVLVGLCIGIVYGIFFARQQTHMLHDGAPKPGWRMLGSTLRRYALLLIVFVAIMYTKSFSIWWVLSGFFVAFWVQVIRLLRVVR